MPITVTDTKSLTFNKADIKDALLKYLAAQAIYPNPATLAIVQPGQVWQQLQNDTDILLTLSWSA